MLGLVSQKEEKEFFHFLFLVLEVGAENPGQVTSPTDLALL
jgi:hypothetical protein